MERKQSSGMGMGLMAVAVSLIFIIGPLAVPGDYIPALSKLILVGFGVFLLLVGTIIITITRLYNKTSADEAFVRTGMGGTKVVVDGGAIAIPVVHTITPVSLRTMKLIVRRHKEEALITGDNLRADVTAEFFVRVQKTKDDILAASTSLGKDAMDPKAVEALVFEKLVSALRTVATTKPLEELNSKRDEFALAVQAIVTKDLAHNGLTLETPTISKLDQTDDKELKPNENVFDAQGAKRIAEITQKARVERNKIERQADQDVKEQDVGRDKFIYLQDVEREEASSASQQSIKKAQAEAQIAEVEKERDIAKSEVGKAQTLEVANQDREKAVRTAEIDKNKTVEIAGRDKEIAVLGKEKERALVAKEQADAESEAETSRQKVKTIEVIQTAERDKDKQVTEAKVAIEKGKLTKNMETDVEVYKLEKTAEATKAAAVNEAEARTTLATAEQAALTSEAAGQQAKDMVPINVLEKKVAVERSELENKSTFDKISKDLAIALAHIAADKEVRVEQAKAVGVAMQAAKITVWGDPSTVTKMMQSFIVGQANGKLLEGLIEATPEGVKDSISGLAKIGAAMLEKFAGIKMAPEQVETAIRKAVGEEEAVDKGEAAATE